MYRLLFPLLAVLIVPHLASSAHAQTLPPTPPAHAAAEAPAPAVVGVVFLVRKPQHARAALRTAAAVRERPATADVPVDLVVCGDGSRSLLDAAPDAAALVAQAEAVGVRLLACGMSLFNLGIDPADLAAGVGVVENGLLHALDRQAEGFLSVEL